MRKKVKKQDQKTIAKKSTKNKKNNPIKLRRGKFSLVLAILFLISSLFLFSVTTISLLQKPIQLISISSLITNYLINYISFVKGSAIFLYPSALIIFVISIMLFAYRKNKPYSYIKMILFLLFSFSMYLLTTKATNSPFPTYLTDTIFKANPTSSQISFRILLSFIIEICLFIIFNPLCDYLNEKHIKRITKKKIKEIENKKSASLDTNKSETLESSPLKDSNNNSVKLEKSDLGVVFPKPIDVPNLSFIDNSSINNDVGSIKTPLNIEKYEVDNKKENSKEEELINSFNSNHTISLETLRIAKKNVEEKMNKLKTPEPIVKKEFKNSNNNEPLSFSSILSQRIKENESDFNFEVSNEKKEESKAVKEYREREIEDARKKVSSIYNSKIRHNSAVLKKKNEEIEKDPLKNIMRSGHLISATQKNNSLNDEIEEIVERQEYKQSTSSIIDEINQRVALHKNEVIDDFSDVDFGDDDKGDNDLSSSLSSNGAPLAKKENENYYNYANYNSTAKAVGDAQLVDEKEISMVKEEEQEDLQSAVAGLSSSSLLNPNKYTYKFPPISLLNEYPHTSNIIGEDTKLQAQILIETLAQFKYDVELRNIVQGPTVTMFEIVPAPGIKVNSITNLRDNIAMNLAAKKVRILAPIPGQTAVGVEIPNLRRDKVGFKEILTSAVTSDMAVPMTLGRTLYGECKSFDVATSPHMLIAGSTGSGKSVCVNSLICSILYTRSPRDVRLIMVDPKVVELTLYNGIPHLLTPVITETKRALKVLDFCIDEMDRRNKMLSKMSVRNIKGYNKKIKELHIAQEKMPYIVVIIDEFASLMSTAGKDLDEKVSRLTAMSRAVGIHLVFATQRPSVDVITGVIKNNLPTRVAFAVTSIQDSRTIIGTTGAEDLLGKGDMLFSANGKAVTRMQGVFLSDEEVENIVEFAKKQEEPDYIDESYFEDPYDDSNESDYDSNNDDDLWDDALRITYENNGISASFLQRRLKIGYNRAARLVEDMEEQGIVGPPNGSKQRELLRYQD